MLNEQESTLNNLTLKIKLKGYTLKCFLLKINFSLRWYRTHEIEGSPEHKFLCEKINELESKIK